MNDKNLNCSDILIKEINSIQKIMKIGLSPINDIMLRSNMIIHNNEKKEIAVISDFLPKQLSEEETKKICQDAIKSVGATSMKDMGKVMGVLKSKHADTLDFSKVSSFIKELLN